MNFFYFMAHWAFKVQYLRTSLVLPKFFTEAKLEYEIDAAQDTTDGSIDLHRLQNAIAPYGE